jgi:hypothetical protein
MTAAEFSKAQWMYGIRHAEYGKIVVATSRHPVANEITTGWSTAKSTSLIAMMLPQAAQQRCPGATRLCLCESFFNEIAIVHLLLVFSPPRASTTRRERSF